MQMAHCTLSCTFSYKFCFPQFFFFLHLIFGLSIFLHNYIWSLIMSWLNLQNQTSLELHIWVSKRQIISFCLPPVELEQNNYFIINNMKRMKNMIFLDLIFGLLNINNDMTTYALTQLKFTNISIKLIYIWSKVV